MTFTDSASRLAGLMPRLFGWRPDDFWCATPAELAAIFDPDGESGDAAPLSRAELDSLLEQDRDG
jgi:uncharacterized phage protein (TIGR02216 family)